MDAVGVLARFEVVPGHDDEVARFFDSGRAVVEGQPATTGWFAFRIGPTTYGAFALFADDADRQALLAAGGPEAVEGQRRPLRRAALVRDGGSGCEPSTVVVVT